MREWLSWWSTTLPRSGSRVRVPSRALFICSGSLDLQGFRFFIGNKRWNFYSSEIHALVYGEKGIIIIKKPKIVFLLEDGYEEIKKDNSCNSSNVYGNNRYITCRLEKWNRRKSGQMAV